MSDGVNLSLSDKIAIVGQPIEKQAEASMPPPMNSDDTLLPLRAITVEGFKSIDHEQTIELRPLTILAGANSSGKSSMIQPLLLLKQTLEAPYDPGPLLIDGANVTFTYIDQFLAKSRREDREGRFSFGFTFDRRDSCKLFFVRTKDQPVELEKIIRVRGDRVLELQSGESDLAKSTLNHPTLNHLLGKAASSSRAIIRRNRCFFDASVRPTGEESSLFPIVYNLEFDSFERAITSTIHVPGLRGNPLRNYPFSAVGDRFPGLFHEYVASVIGTHKDDLNWLKYLSDDLVELGLTWKVEAKKTNDAQIELRVGRLPRPKRGGAQDLVSIADVGFGVSQTLPVVVALRIARPGQTVYIEQPELHLHPKAQHAMAQLLAAAAKRGVQVIIETHSSLLLLGVQSLIAKGELDPALVKLHWFNRDEEGLTKITSKDPDAAGRFGDWPVDFDDVSLEAQMAYLNAAEKRVAAHE